MSLFRYAALAVLICSLVLLGLEYGKRSQAAYSRQHVTVLKKTAQDVQTHLQDAERLQDPRLLLRAQGLLLALRNGLVCETDCAALTGVSLTELCETSARLSVQQLPRLRVEEPR